LTSFGLIFPCFVGQNVGQTLANGGKYRFNLPHTMPHKWRKVQSKSAAFYERKIKITIQNILLSKCGAKRVKVAATAFHAVNSGSNPLGDATSKLEAHHFTLKSGYCGALFVL
jgi:hypothetical protein